MAARITTMVDDMIATAGDADEIRMSARRVGRDDGAARVPVRQRLLLRQREGRGAEGVPGRSGAFRRTTWSTPRSFLDELCPRDETELVWCVIDYVAGMTDRFAIREFERLFVPKKWLV